MTTTFPSKYGYRFTLDYVVTHPDHVMVQMEDGQGDSVDRLVPRAEFLAAVAAELDVIVIPRADLPEVVVDGDTYTVGGASWPSVSARKHAQGIRRDAMENLALAEYLDAHPPIEVEAACAWSDYRKDYGASGSAEHKAFLAGFKAARDGDQAGALR